MVLTFIILYLLVSIGIGLFAATRVHNVKDFAVAGRSLPVPIVMATVFATWFGAEAVMGISATFAREGLRGVVADPFGSSLCSRWQDYSLRRASIGSICSRLATTIGSATTAGSKCSARCALSRPISDGSQHSSKCSASY